MKAVVDFYGGGGGGTLTLEREVRGLPPLLILHGEKDSVVGVSFAEALRSAVLEAGGQVEMHPLYQGVTLGARSFQVDASGALVKGRPRHPVVEDDVTIYASATVLGRITIGRGSVVGGNVWLTHSVPTGSRVYQAEPLETGFEEGGGI